jgi:hypothetical protein
MTDIDELVSQIPISQLAGKLGLSEEETEAAVSQAVPALVSGMAANAQDPAGAASLADALGEHDGGLLDAGIDLEKVDTSDGEKIVHNVFGDNQDAVVNQLGGLEKLGGGTFAKLLPLLAPLVMAFLAKSRSSTSASGATTGAMGSGGLGDLLGGLLGGGAGGAGGGALGGGLGDVLGGLLGGGKR